MAVGYLMEVAGGTQEQYDRVMVELNLEAQPAQGLISHNAGAIDGGWRVVDIWESPDAFETFLQTRLGAAIRKAGLGEPRISRWPIYNSIRA